tara:strand:- start:98 stop:700 length:603 start_codon:yes stop_codon:yes gene_type:complete
MANIKIVESERNIVQKANKAMAQHLNKVLPRAARKVRGQVESLFSSALYASPEIASLSNGVLRAEFGLTFDPTNQLVRAIVSSLDMSVDKVNNKLQGGFTIVMQPTDYGNLLSLPIAYQPVDGGALPWLMWLLTLGDSIIIGNFGFEVGNHGRTGRGHMVKTKAPYKVNGAFSGTVDNNFITRAIARVMPEIKEIILRSI